MKIAYGIGDGETSELCERLIFILRASLLCVYNFIATQYTYLSHEHNVKENSSANFTTCDAKSYHRICLFLHVHTVTLLRANGVHAIFGGIHTHGGSSLFVYCSHAHEKMLFFWFYECIRPYLFFSRGFSGEKKNIGGNMEKWSIWGRHAVMT